MGCCVDKPKKDDEFASIEDDNEPSPTDPSTTDAGNLTLRGPFYGSCPHMRPAIPNGSAWYWFQGNKNRLTPTENRQPCIRQLALAMYKTELTAAAIVGVPGQPYLSSAVTECLVRKAKHEGSTVTLRDGHLYIDYKYVGRVPPGTKITS